MYQYDDTTAVEFINGQILSVDNRTLSMSITDNSRFVAVAMGVWARLIQNRLSFMVIGRDRQIYEVPYNRCTSIYTHHRLFITLDHIAGTIHVINPLNRTTLARKFVYHALTSYWYTNGFIVQVFPGRSHFNYYSIDDDVFHTEHVFENMCYKCFHRADVLSVRHNGEVFLFDLSCNHCHVVSFCLGSVFIHDHLGPYELLTENVAVRYRRNEVVVRNVRTYSTISLPWFSRPHLICAYELQKNVMILVLKRELQMSKFKPAGYALEKFHKHGEICVYIFKEVPLQ